MASFDFNNRLVCIRVLKGTSLEDKVNKADVASPVTSPSEYAVEVEVNLLYEKKSGIFFRTCEFCFSSWALEYVIISVSTDEASAECQLPWNGDAVRRLDNICHVKRKNVIFLSAVDNHLQIVVHFFEDDVADESRFTVANLYRSLVSLGRVHLKSKYHRRIALSSKGGRKPNLLNVLLGQTLRTPSNGDLYWHPTCTEQSRLVTCTNHRIRACRCERVALTRLPVVETTRMANQHLQYLNAKQHG